MRSITGPVALWLVVQLFALVLAAFRIPLSAHYPAAGESLALQMMVIVQTVALALLAPVLLRSKWSAIAIALTAGPMLQLAGVLAQVSVGRVMIVWANVVVLTLGLYFWNQALGRKGQMLLIALASMLTLGGALCWYLSAEFGSSSSTYWSPTTAAIALARGSTSTALQQWGAVVGILASGAVAAWVARGSKKTHS